MTAQPREEVALDRRVPRWAAMLIARLTQDRPSVLTRDDVAGYLHEIDSAHDVDRVIRELVSLEWLVASRRKGVWVFMAPGETALGDPYVGL